MPSHQTPHSHFNHAGGDGLGHAESWKQLKAAHDLISCAPDDEVLAELLACQQELVTQMLCNQTALAPLLAAAVEDLPRQAAARQQRAKMAEDMRAIVLVRVGRLMWSPMRCKAAGWCVYMCCGWRVLRLGCVCAADAWRGMCSIDEEEDASVVSIRHGQSTHLHVMHTPCTRRLIPARWSTSPCQQRAKEQRREAKRRKREEQQQAAKQSLEASMAESPGRAGPRTRVKVLDNLDTDSDVRVCGCCGCQWADVSTLCTPHCMSKRGRCSHSALCMQDVDDAVHHGAAVHA